MVAEYRSIFLSNLREMLHLKSFYGHTDLQGTRITRDEEDVKSLVDLLENTWINPFDPDTQELVSISTGKVAPPEVQEHLLLAREKGNTAYQEFSQQRIESSPPVLDFYHKMTKLKLKTFSDLIKKKTFRKENGKEIILKADRVLFGQMIVIAQSRNLSMNEVLVHPLGPLPWSLATPDGSLRKTNKATLAKELQRNVPAVDIIPLPSATIIDGMALVQRLKGDHKTFSEVGDALLNMALNESYQSTRIDIVFDVYRSDSIKNSERQNRVTEAGTRYRNINPGHKVQQWRKFVADASNKQALTSFLCAEWQTDKYRQRLQQKVLYVACEEQCVKITQEQVQVVDDLISTQEEADTRLLLHGAHAAKDRYQSVIIVSEDTDVFILCLAFQCEIPSSIYMKCGTQTRTRYVDITKIAEMLGEETCKALPGLHSLTGCDTVSAFAGKGKVSALKMLKRDRNAQIALQQLGAQWELSPGLFQQLERFICQLYNSKPGTDSVNTLRYMLFCAKKGDIDSHQLPPCSDCLQKHCQRANYQTRLWRQCLVACPDVPSPVGLGWCQESDQDGTSRLTVDWMDGDPAPSAVLQLLSCKCKRSCQPSNCSCIRNGLKCTDMCSLQDCQNRANDCEVQYVDDDDDKDDDVY
ncbi:hypothetical protein QZH41_005565 [Actinostola sp. cb2023]|nr:hypothetical protein QZH41_005565 [Actinostola sp. cb2023]